MVDRIKQVMEYEQMSPASFADAIEINRSSLTHIFTGRNQPSLDVARKILKAFPEVRTEWLIMGVGQMLQDVSQQQTLPDPEVTTVDNMQQTDLFSGMDESPRKPHKVETEPVVKTETVSAPIVDIPAVSVAPEVLKSETPKVVVEEKVSVKTVAPAIPEINQPVLETENVIPEETSVTSRARNAKMAESHNSTPNTKRDRISNSQGDKKIAKIIFFYEDKSYDIYIPN